ALNERERVVVCLAGVLVITALAYLIGIEPGLKRRAQLLDQFATEEQTLKGARTQREQAMRDLALSPDEAVRIRLAEVGAEITRLDEHLDGLQRELLRPDRMAPVLQELVGRDEHVRLVSLRNLPPAAIGAQAAAEGGPSAPNTGHLYRHGVEIVVEGSYADVVNYVVRLERQPWHLYWGKTQLSSDYPKSTLTLTLYTLSLDKVWLVV